MAGTREIPASLTACFGPGQIRRGNENDEVDGIVPSLALTVREPSEIANVVLEAASEELGVLAVGGGTSIGSGNPPSRYDIRLSMRGMAAVTELCPADMTVTAEAGMTLSGLNRRLAEHGQRITLDPDLPERRTLGGLAAEGFSGGLSYGFGAMRDLVLGLSVVDGKGRMLRTGGRVVKNVAGYDLPLLFVGSAGTLGVITELTLRTHPLPEAEVTLVFNIPSVEELRETTAVLFASPLPLTALDFSADATGGGDTNWRLELRLEGSEQQVGHQWACLVELLGRDPDRRTAAWSSPAVVRETDRVAASTVTGPAQAVDLAASLTAAASEQPLRVGANLGSGRVLLALQERPAPDKEAGWINSVRQKAAQQGLGLRVDKCSAAAKASVTAWPGNGQTNGGARLMAEIKRRFDPAGVLSPGRFVTIP